MGIRVVQSMHSVEICVRSNILAHNLLKKTASNGVSKFIW